MITNAIRLGRSCEYNAVILVGRQNDKIESKMLWFDTSGEYFGVCTDDPADIPEDYREEALFQGFVDSITLNGHYALLEAEEIVFYRKGPKNCVILTVNHTE